MRCVAVPHILWLPLWGSWHGEAVTEREAFPWGKVARSAG